MSTSNKDKQEKEERHYLDDFLRILNCSCDDIKRGDDPPDFIIRLKRNLVSVEMTDYYSSVKSPSGHTRRSVEEEWTELQSKIDAVRKSSDSLKQISFYLWFRELLLPSSKEKDQFIKELFLFVESVQDKINADRPQEFDDFEKYPLLKKYLRDIRLKLSKAYLSSASNISGGFVDESEESLISVIRPKLKNPSLKGPYWLVVTCGHQLSQSFGSPVSPSVGTLQSFNSLNALLESGPFNSVYIHQYMFNRVLDWTHSQGWKEIKN